MNLFKYIKHFLILLLITISTNISIAQTIIKGLIIDEITGDPLEFATISVYQSKDNSLIGGGTSDFDGNFEIEVTPALLTVEFSFLSYGSTKIENLDALSSSIIELGTIKLAPDVQIMDEIEVVGQKSRIQMGLDKRVFNVDADLARTGGTVTELLDNIPSVSVDVEGNVSLRGSQGVTILIDGKPSGLIGLGDAQGLQLLQSNMIESIEIITNPSARYDASGSAGIINIILKKDRQKGINAALDLNAGIPANNGAALNLNYRTSTLNLFANGGFSRRKRLGNGFSTQNFIFPDLVYTTERSNQRDRGGLNANFQFGSDWYINSKNTLTGSFLYRKGDDDNYSEVNYRDFYSGGELFSESQRIDNEKEDESTTEFNINYKRTFDKKDKVLTFDVQYQNNSEVENSAIEEVTSLQDGAAYTGDPLLQRSLNDERETRLLLQLDYVNPIGEEGKFEAGFRSTIRDLFNDYLVEEFQDNWFSLEGLSNNFEYNEDIHAVYTSYGNKYGKFSLQTGMRLEYSNIKTRLIAINDINDRNYLNFFPSVFLTYEATPQGSFQISYSRRIRRPRFWDLNPFFSFSDDRNIRSGNPNLNPEFTNSFELSHIQYGNLLTLTSALYVRATEGVIERITSVEDDGISYSRPENMSSSQDMGAEFTLSGEFRKWLNLSGNINLFRQVINGGDFGEDFNTDNFSWTGRFNARMKLWNKLNWQIMFNYRGAIDRPQGRSKAIAYFDTGLGMDVFKNKATINLNIRDVFNSRRYQYETFLDNYNSSGYFRWGVTTITLGFNYRINQDKPRDNRKGGGDGNFDGGDM